MCPYPVPQFICPKRWQWVCSEAEGRCCHRYLPGGPLGRKGKERRERGEREKNGKGDSGRERKGFGKGGKIRKEGNEERKEKVPLPPHPNLIAPRREVGDITQVCVLVMARKAGNLGSAVRAEGASCLESSAVRRIQTRWVAGGQDLGGISVHRFPHGAGGRAPPCCWALQQPRKGAGARVLVGGKVTVAPISGQGPSSHPASTPTGLGGLEQPSSEWVFGIVFLCACLCV